MNTSGEEGIDAKSVWIVLTVIIVIVVVTGVALFLRKRQKSVPQL
jgi:flagellar basal body-associated protein FliL